ncbi:GAF and ANTAR domain-containing protein [Streptomonospora sp. S1-112]|uniref:GAF and ANTAR domain-containing protein n=1 Tax=Streptomonospora mangrovi TaxID=2883123 RepID=A0A9X3NQA7_9ACTN|nr:GAF and ANTAR domain-containing protein [Streptomonospora mangrovi]MDA0567919.1 GAF and ANTAR domain-containing protein [Streptomonospora mangrovi]
MAESHGAVQDRHIRLFAEMARELLAQDTVDDVLQRISELAVETVKGCEAAGVMLLDRRRHTLETPAATHEFVRASDRAQFECDEGPCLDAARHEQSFRVDDMAAETRWPSYRPRAVELGVGSMLGFELYTHDSTLGALDLYSTRANAFGPDALEIGWAFASHAVVAIAAAQREATLRSGYETRQEIGEAVGIIMERRRLTSDQAFAVLRTASNNTNTKLREVARSVALTGEIPEI